MHVNFKTYHKLRRVITVYTKGSSIRIDNTAYNIMNISNLTLLSIIRILLTHNMDSENVILLYDNTVIKIINRI